MSALPPIPPNIVEITAAPLLGSIWNWALYGVLVVQIYVYSYNFPEDRTSLKSLVYAVFLIETVQTGLSGADLYYRFASGFGNMNHMANPYVSAFEVPLIGAVVSLPVQFFFAYRVWLLSNKKSWWLCLAICLFSTFNALAAFAWGVYAHTINRFVTGWRLTFFGLTWFIGNTTSDTLIMTAMLYHLIKRQYPRGDPFRNHALTKVVRLVVETNIMTTATGIVALLMVIVFPSKNWYTCPAAVLGKLYSNTLLVSLNNRISIRDESHARGGLSRSRIIEVPSTSSPSGVMHLELEKTSFAPQERTYPGKGEGQERVVDISSLGFPSAKRDVVV